jgi:hypothetical protein
MRFVARRDHAGPGPVGQGTVVGTPEQGTIGGPKLPPTATQYGGSVVTPNTETVVNQGGAWPENRALPIVPNTQQAAREFVFDTRAELQAGPPPGRILRQLFARVFGYTSVGGGDPIGNYGFPYNGDWAYIPHQKVPRAPYGPSPMLRQWDNNAPISAVYAGNPRGGQ